MAPRVQIIAYGNPLRSDDGLAWRVADTLGDKLSREEVEIAMLHQLGPELAESISRSECVIFIDAASGPGPPGEIRITELLPVCESSGAAQFCHAVSPPQVLALAAQLYGAHPHAFTATVVGDNFDHGEFLSEPVQAAIPALVARIDELARGFINHKGHEITRRKD